MDKKQKKSEIVEAFHFRHATKKFDPNQKISTNDFRFILEAGYLSPSSFGIEPWRFLIVQNETLRRKIKDISWGAKGKIMDASHFVIYLSRTQKDLKYDADYLKDHFLTIHEYPGDRVEGLLSMIENFQKSDFELTDERRISDWASKQTYIALANTMTAAAQIGIDSCPIEGFSIREMNEFLREEGLLEDDSFSISVMAAFGYREAEPAAKKRRPLHDVIKWIE
ncbi:NAD(P)H-dependent oxidoreductase [Gracilibacillus oryzae]|uniref:NAD(P)H-dependent oxidoreductase n=1 Tax=Gracilibacillus oryzae TaxID=1672701 RepID=A0A7C8KXP1_9BACI|nr:NAD(P)H-dependent oxidoreductase [Gracilibacillus oryzae]KAB8128295.1 NAD(P)H-dependent oxidoreductase [Gracilibacillus oryzae]